MKKEFSLSFLIPCLNEAETIEGVVEAAFQAGKKWLPGKFEVVVADNGSTDGSIEKVKKQRRARLIKVLIRGYGAALHWGILKAEGEYVLYADADLSYDFDEIKKFVRYLDKNYDLVLGSRMRGKIDEGAMPLLNRYLGTPVLTALIRLMYRIKTTDCNSGMRMVRKDFYKNLKMRNSGMEWASELLLKTALHRGKYTEVAIDFHRDQRKRPPHLLRWVDGWRHLKAIVLIKPNSLFIPFFIFTFLALIYLRISFTVAFFFTLLAGALFLSILAVKMLHFAIEGTRSRLLERVRRIPIVPIAILLTILSFLLLFLIPEKHQGTKLFISGAVIIFDMWVFLIETIKTHLVNRLP
jgi:glycosyltransferase involved in cell wall biosynthesis